MLAVETGQISSVETGQMSAVETGRMSAIEIGQRFAETGQMFAVEKRHMYSIKTGQRPVAIVDICLVSTTDICPVSAADICPVSTEDIWLLWGHLGKVENDFDPFFTPKMRKLEQISLCRWSRWSHGNDAMGRAAELRIQRRGSRTRAGSSASCPRAQVGPPRLIQRPYCRFGSS